MIVGAAGAAPQPYAWHPHLGTWAVLVGVPVAVVAIHRHQVARSRTAPDARPAPAPWTRRQQVALAGPSWLAPRLAFEAPEGFFEITA